MWDFFKKIFSGRDGDLTVVVIDENEPEDTSSFRFEPADVVKLILVMVLISVTITTVIFYITPLGTLYQHQKDESLRQDVLMISEKIVALQDSLNARDRQLSDLKQVLVEVPDTVFQTQFFSESDYLPEPGFRTSMVSSAEIPAYEMLSRNEIIFSDILKKAPLFPTSYPVEGTFTQGFDAEDKHFGIDIAAGEQTEFKAIADGTVINAGWTSQYGYTLYLQHGDGFVSVYKHGAKLFREDGDIVMKGDLLGTVGDQGALSYGSHLHLEIWKNGVAQDPQMYLIK